MSIPISELVRMPAGTKEIYILAPGADRSYFYKKLSTYAFRAKAKVDHKVATVVWDDDDMVSRMISVKVIKQGKRLKRRGRKSQ